MKYDAVENTLPEFNTAELGLTPPSTQHVVTCLSSIESRNTMKYRYTGHSCIELSLFMPLKNLTVRFCQVMSGYGNKKKLVVLPQSTLALASVSLKSHSSHAMLWCWTKYWDVSDGQWKHVDSLGQVGPREVTMKLYIHTYIVYGYIIYRINPWGRTPVFVKIPRSMIEIHHVSCCPQLFDASTPSKSMMQFKSAKIPWEIQAFPSKTMKLH